MKIRINGIEIDAILGETILEAAKKAGIHIPTLCYHEAFGGQGHCRMCMVEVKKGASSRLVASCTYPITEEIEVNTSNPLIEKIRRNIVMLLYKRAPASELMEKLYQQYNCPDYQLAVDPEERCILCRLCVKACEEMGNSAISAVMRGTEKRVSTPFEEASVDCIGCAACAEVCPTGAIKVFENKDERKIWDKSFKLLHCDRCGRTVGTREELQYMKTKLGQELAANDLCENCRKKELAQKLKQFSQ